MPAHEAGAQVMPPPADVLFKSPSSISVHNNHTVFVADTGNHRIQVFDRNGAFKFAFGSEGSGEGQFLSPGGVGMGHGEYLFVADTGNHRVQQFFPNGMFYRVVGTNGTGDGEFV